MTRDDDLLMGGRTSLISLLNPSKKKSDQAGILPEKYCCYPLRLETAKHHGPLNPCVALRADMFA